MIEVKKTDLKDCYIIQPKVFGDHRGWFMETFSEKDLLESGLNYNFVQGNESYTKVPGTLRGLHFQKGDAAQAKLVRVSKGAVYDVVVDLREESPSYLQWIKVELTSENKTQLLVPRGFAHGFITLSPDVEFNYVVDNPYCYAQDAGIIFNDPQFNIDWGVDNPILSDKDAKLPTYEEYKLSLRRNV